jgi:hypothetical protein
LALDGATSSRPREFARIPATETSGNWGQTGVADIDNDGRLDFLAGNYERIWWWHNPSC